MVLDYGKLKTRRSGARSGIGWRPKEGENKVRVLPPHSRYLTAWETMEDIAVSFNMHYFKIEGRQTEVSRCREELKQRCPACEMWRTYRKSDDPGMKELAGQIRPADTYLLNILDPNDLRAGVQYWTANYTCWDKILEIVANPDWGNVLDPADGVDFTVNMIPGGKSRTGYNTYSVTPSPVRTSVEQVLNAFPDWRQKLDELQDQVSGVKEESEMHALLEEMGFPPIVRVSAASPPRSLQPELATAPTPVQPALAPAQPAALAPAQPAAATDGAGYDPGPEYEPKVPDAERPEGSPRCYGDYNPAVHRCPSCPVLTECQMKMLGVV